jgi:hypothetical protein
MNERITGERSKTDKIAQEAGSILGSTALTA